MGKNIGLELGFYSGCVEAIYEASQSRDDPISVAPGALRSLKKLRVLLKAMPDSRVVCENEKMTKRLQLIRVKMKTLEKRLGWEVGSLRCPHSDIIAPAAASSSSSKKTTLF